MNLSVLVRVHGRAFGGLNRPEAVSSAREGLWIHSNPGRKSMLVPMRISLVAIVACVLVTGGYGVLAWTGGRRTLRDDVRYPQKYYTKIVWRQDIKIFGQFIK